MNLNLPRGGRTSHPSAVVSFLRRELRGKLRVWLSWIILPLILFNIKREPALEGLLLILGGALLRAWASGLLRKEGELCSNGPYTFSRNPLYLGSILLGLAIPISQHNWWLTGVILVANVLMFYPLIAAEEAVLTKKFGAIYVLYRQTVGRFFSPLRFLTFAFARKGDGLSEGGIFSWALWKKNKGWEPLCVGAALIVATYSIVYFRTL